MMLLERLLQTQHAPQAACEGQWRVLRLALDQATGEHLNVGVAFTDRKTGTTHTRLLSNVAGLRCLYGDDMANDAAFLIDQAEQALEQGIALPADWNVQLSPPRFMRGTSGQEIVEELYQRLVPLSRHETAEERLDTDDHSHNTRHVRKTVADLIRKHLQTKKTPEFWRTAPVEAGQAQEKVTLDLQVLGNGRKGQQCGTVVSAWYKSAYHRGAYLNQAANTILGAREVYPNARHVLYVLRPDVGLGFGENELNAIDKDVDSTKWLLDKHHITLEPCTTERALAEQVLLDMGVI